MNEAATILKSYEGPKIRIMEVCGTHTHEIFKLGIRQLLSPDIELISGPGCPVCVTSADYIDEACWLAREKGCVITTFGDLVKVPGIKSSMVKERGQGAQINVVYSPQDAVLAAEKDPDREVVFLSVGFETTTPSDVIAVKYAKEKGIKNFSILTANKTMPRAYEVLADSTDCYLYPGHVHAITGTADCKAMLAKGTSGVIAGFTGPELLTALVKDEGSPAAMKLVNEFMEPCDALWRGIGVIPMSGMKLRDEFSEFDARVKFAIPDMKEEYKTPCRCGDVLQGKIKPFECPMFGKACIPDHPVGACMVSDEGACSAYYMYGGLIDNGR